MYVKLQIPKKWAPKQLVDVFKVQINLQILSHINVIFQYETGLLKWISQQEMVNAMSHVHCVSMSYQTISLFLTELQEGHFIELENSLQASLFNEM